MRTPQPSPLLPPLSDTASAMVFARQFSDLSSSAALRNVRRVRLNPEAMRQPQPATENRRLDESGSNVGVACRSLRPAAQAQILAAMQKVVPGLGSAEFACSPRVIAVCNRQRAV